MIGKNSTAKRKRNSWDKLCKKKVKLRSPFSAADWDRHIDQTTHQKLANKDSKPISQFFVVREGV